MYMCTCMFLLPPSPLRYVEEQVTASGAARRAAHRAAQAEAELAGVAEERTES